MYIGVRSDERDETKVLEFSEQSDNITKSLKCIITLNVRILVFLKRSSFLCTCVRVVTKQKLPSVSKILYMCLHTLIRN